MAVRRRRPWVTTSTRTLELPAWPQKFKLRCVYRSIVALWAGVSTDFYRSVLALWARKSPREIQKREKVELDFRRELDINFASGFNSCFSDTVFVTSLSYRVGH